MRFPRFIRRVTDPVLSRIAFPVLSGVNRGRLWNVISGSGYITGRRQRQQMELISRLVQPGDIAWDVGAHHGYVTVCMAQRVGPSGRVHAFEPGRRSVGALRRHLRWNRIRNAEVHEVALSDADGTAQFGGHGSSKGYALGRGDDQVDIRTATTVVAKGAAPPTFAKVDVENSEAAALEGMISILGPEARLLISMHSRESDRQCTAMLLREGFELFASKNLRSARAGAWIDDPDLFAIRRGSKRWDHDTALIARFGFASDGQAAE